MNKVAPNSVHVWRGYKSPKKTFKEFATFLGSVFVPACALLQPKAGLHAYVPSMPIQKNKPAEVPDQTALMFWTSPEVYHEGFETVAVRSYTNLHGDAYGPGSSAEFPVIFNKKVKIEQPYFLINKEADWMQGEVSHLIASPDQNQSQDSFEEHIEQWASSLQDNPPGNLNGGLLCVGKGYVVAWLLWDKGSNLKEGESPFLDLTPNMQTWLNCIADTYKLPATLWDKWPGIDLLKNDTSCLNIQLKE